MRWLNQLRARLTGTANREAGPATHAAPATAPAHRPRAPRARVIELLNVHFIPSDAAIAARIGISNLSTTGVGLLLRGTPHWPAQGSLVRGEIDFSGTRVPVTLRLVQAAETVVGGSFEDESPALRDMIQRYFEIELSALAMVPTPPAMLQEEPRGEPRWYHGANGCELFYVAAGAELYRFNFAFFGNYVEDDGSGRARYGHVIEEAYHDKPKYKGSSLVQWQSSMPPEMKKTAMRFLANVPGLTPEMRKVLDERVQRIS